MKGHTAIQSMNAANGAIHGTAEDCAVVASGISVTGIQTN
jgi:hypothetical protein